jgi:hypothetical protein
MTHLIILDTVDAYVCEGKRKVARIEETRRETKKTELQDDYFDPTLDISNSRLENKLQGASSQRYKEAKISN